MKIRDEALSERIQNFHASAQYFRSLESEADSPADARWLVGRAAELLTLANQLLEAARGKL